MIRKNPFEDIWHVEVPFGVSDPELLLAAREWCRENVPSKLMGQVQTYNIVDRGWHIERFRERAIFGFYDEPIAVMFALRFA